MRLSGVVIPGPELFEKRFFVIPVQQSRERAEGLGTSALSAIAGLSIWIDLDMLDRR